MKRKLLLITLMIALFVMVLAVSASATTIYKDQEGTELFTCELYQTRHIDSYEIKNGGFAKTDANGNALTWYLVSTETDESGNTIKNVASMKTSECYANGSYNNGVTLATVVSASWDEGITSIPTFGGIGSPAAKEALFVYLPASVTALQDRIMQATNVVVFDIPVDSQLTTIGLVPFYDAKSLRKIYIPSGVTEIKFKDGHEPFNSAQKLETVEFAKDCVLTTLPHGTFKNCSSLKSITMPDSMTTVSSRVFNGCSSLEYIKFGANFTYMVRTAADNHSFAFLATNLKTVIIPKTFKAENMADNLDYSFQTTWASDGDVVFYYTGTLEEFQAIQAKFALAGNNGVVCGATVENGRLVLVNHCETYYDGVHDFEGEGGYENSCAKKCSRCEYFELNENPKHTLINEITYENGYGSKGSKVLTCTNQGCTHNATESANAIFALLGYSTSVDGAQFCAGYTIDYVALVAFTSETNLAKNHPTSIQFGMVAAVGDNTESPLSINAEGNVCVASDKLAIQATLNDKPQVRSVNFKINGGSLWETNTELLVAMNMYVYDGKSLSYVGSSVSTANPYTVMYKDYIQKQDPEIPQA